MWGCGRARRGGVYAGEELADVDRLGEVVAGAGGAQVGDLGGGDVGADYYDWYLGGVGIGAQLAEDFIAGDVWEVEVEEDEVGGMLAREFEGAGALVGGDEFHAGTLREDALDETEIGRVVLDVEHDALGGGVGLVGVGGCAICAARRLRCGCALDEREFDPKCRALAGIAFDADPAAHRFDELLGKGEPESGALSLARGGLQRKTE